MSLIKFSYIKRKEKFINIEKNINIDVGDRVAIIGRNGSGKTSLIKAIIGELKTENDIEKISNKEIGYQMQESKMIDNLKVKEYIELVLLKKLSNEEIVEHNLENIINKKIKVLSGGEKQFLILFLTIFSKKKLYFFDELTTGLDSDKRKLIINKLKNDKLNSFCLVTHYFEEAEELCNKILIMNSGEIIIYDNISDIKNNYNMNFKIEDDKNTVFYKEYDEAIKNIETGQIVEKVNIKDIVNFFLPRGENV